MKLEPYNIPLHYKWKVCNYLELQERWTPSNQAIINLWSNVELKNTAVQLSVKLFANRPTVALWHSKPIEQKSPRTKHYQPVIFILKWHTLKWHDKYFQGLLRFIHHRRGLFTCFLAGRNQEQFKFTYWLLYHFSILVAACFTHKHLKMIPLSRVPLTGKHFRK